MATQTLHQFPMSDLRAARVTGVAGPWFFLADPADTGTSVDRALCAASCLLTPVQDDFVLYSAPQPVPAMTGAGLAGHRAAYIVAVLFRANADAGRIDLPGGAAIEASNGNMRMVGEQLELSARSDIAIDTPAIDIHSVVASLRASQVDTTAAALRARLGSMDLMASRVTATFGRVWQTMQDSFRQVAGLDDTRAGRVRWQVATQTHVQARHITLLAEEHVKIDGAKVDLG